MTDDLQQVFQDPQKPNRGVSKASLVIWSIVAIICGIFIWARFTEQGQQTFASVADKGVRGWLQSGDTAAEQVIATELEKAGVIVTKDQGRITSLNFAACSKPDDAILAKLSQLDDLSSLNMANVAVTDAQLAHLQNLKNLKSLSLNASKITDAGLNRLTELSTVQSLQIGYNDVTDAGLDAVVKITSLHVLDLSYTKITDQGLKRLNALSNLNWLLIRGDSVTDAGVSSLSSIAALKHLTLSKDMKVSSSAVEQLKKALPQLTVDSFDPDSAEESKAEINQ